MAEVDYIGWAQAMGQRNPVATGLNDIGNTLTALGQQDLERKRLDKQNRLADIQIQQAQMAMQEARRKQADNEELRNTLANLQPTATPAQYSPAQLAAHTPEALDLAQGKTPQVWDDSMNGGAGGMVPAGDTSKAQAQLSLASMAPQIPGKVTPADPMQALFDHALKTGAVDDARKALDMKAYIIANAPDKLQAAEALKQLTTFSSALKSMKELKQAGVLSQSLLDGMLGMMPESIQQKFPNGIKLSEVTADGSLEVKDRDGNVIGHWAVSPDGTKTELIKSSADGKSFDTIDQGDKVLVIPRDKKEKPYYLPKGISPTSAAQVIIQQGKPLPAPIVKEQNEMLDKISMASGISADLNGILSQLKDGSLQLGPVKNLNSAARNKVGMSDENSRNYGTFKNTLEKLRNDSLRLNKGVQTDGDAQRAWNELMSNINDQEFVKKRLEEIDAINQRAVAIQTNMLNDTRAEYGKGSMDTSRYATQPATIGNKTRPAAAPGVTSGGVTTIRYDANGRRVQ